MKRLLTGAWLACALLGAAASAQQTLDVPFVGTPPAVVERMLAMANVGPDDFVVDLGCGDGRLVITAAKRHGARGYGVDLDPVLVHEAQREARRQGVQERAAFEVRNLYVTDIGRASVLTLYLFPRVNLDLRPRIFREVKPGTRVVSHEFDFGSWRPDEQATVEVPDKPYGPPRSTVYLWIVPADATGQWTWGLPQHGAETVAMTLSQTFQVVRPEVPAGAGYRIENARLRGDELTFERVAGQARERYRGRITGDTISGTVATGTGTAPWAATRVARGKLDIEAGGAVRPATYAKESR